MSKYNLACGNEYLEGWVNVDNKSMFPNCKVDFNEDIFEWNTAPDSVDVIRLSHFVMYTRPEELRKLLTRWHSFLRDGGTIEIEAPDVKKICRLFLSLHSVEHVDSMILTNLYGNETTCPHRWGWYPNTLRDILRQCGFTNIVTKKGDKKPKRDFKIIATKHGKRH